MPVSENLLLWFFRQSCNFNYIVIHCKNTDSAPSRPNLSPVTFSSDYSLNKNASKRSPRHKNNTHNQPKNLIAFKTVFFLLFCRIRSLHLVSWRCRRMFHCDPLSCFLIIYFTPCMSHCSVNLRLISSVFFFFKRRSRNYQPFHINRLVAAHPVK